MYFHSLRPQHARLSIFVAALLLAIGLTGACTGHHALVWRPAAEPAGLTTWFGPDLIVEQARLERWAKSVGPPVVVTLAGHAADRTADSILLLTWNVAVGDGDIERLVEDVRRSHPGVPLVLLLQEAYRQGPEVPTAISADAVFPRRLGNVRSNRGRRDVADVAARCGLNLYYVPSMRNGSPAASDEDRGNAILSSLPLEELTAIELPFERQRRVAVAATAKGLTSDGRPWRIRLVSAHLDNMVGRRRLWVAGGLFARARQAKGLVDTLRDYDTAVLGGDFNTWLGFGDPAFTGTQAAFPDTHVTDRRPTFRNFLRLDHLFFRLPDGWTAQFERAPRAYGSDHWPLMATIRMLP
jgi:endonuclease/exonuclease/phosphatase family metal-dependent hydrolase